MSNYNALPTARTRSSYSQRLQVKAEIERRKRAGATGGKFRSFQKQYRDDWVALIHDCMEWGEGQSPTAYQDEIVAGLQSQGRAAVRGPHGLGKTALASWVILAFALTRDGEDWKIPTTASAWRQLTKFLWPEVRKWARKLRWDKIGREPFDNRSELLKLSLKLETGEAFAVASDTAELIEGAHADHLLYVFDEAKTIPPDTWDAAEGALSSGECYALAISTPGEPQGRFYQIHKREHGYEDWWTRHVTLDEAIAAGRVSQEWAKKRKRQWGEGSAVYQNRVLGEFASSEEDGVISLSWVEAANLRWQMWNDDGRPLPDKMTAVGVDVARSGTDKTVMALRYGNIVTELRRYSKEDTMQTAGRVAGVLKAHGGRAVVDIIGIGAGSFDRLREQGFDVLAFNASERTDKTDKSGELGFINKRAAAWWQLRELLDPISGEMIALPPDDILEGDSDDGTLTGDLTSPKWQVMSGGKIKIESKKEIKKRLGRSTDDGDATIQSFWRDEDKDESGFGFLF